ncbi:MAG: hypothetical protein ABGZ19_15715 [Verrucomicrobiales bacterium]
MFAGCTTFPRDGNRRGQIRAVDPGGSAGGLLAVPTARGVRWGASFGLTILSYYWRSVPLSTIENLCRCSHYNNSGIKKQHHE